MEDHEYCTQDPSEVFQSCFVDTFFFKRAHTLFDLGTVANLGEIWTRFVLTLFQPAR